MEKIPWEEVTELGLVLTRCQIFDQDLDSVIWSAHPHVYIYGLAFDNSIVRHDN